LSKKTYTTEHIVEMGEIEHIRNNTGMYIGSSETATRLLEEVIDNALDEVQTNCCNSIVVIIDNKNKWFSVIDNGRGFPFNQKLPLGKDPPVLSCTKLFTSGKFKKGESNSAYDIATGLHGIGLVACNALSDKMILDIYSKKPKKRGTYTFLNGEDVTRKEVPYSIKNLPYSTRIIVYPSEKYFSNVSVDIDHIEERLRIACANYPKLKIAFKIDGKNKVISGTEEVLILDYLSKTCDKWYNFSNTIGSESYTVKIGWDSNSPVTSKYFTSVNLVRVHSGIHINKVTTILKNVFTEFAKKHKFTFNPEDCLTWIRIYINLKIIDTSFEAQVKVKLERKSNLSVMNNLEIKIKRYFEANKEELLELLERFQTYRDSIKNKKLFKNTNGKSRGVTSFTKLKDCSKPHGELLISEGDSAAGGLIQVRDPRKHAVLPLKGVIPNTRKKKDKILNNAEIKDIVQALGCGINKDCDVTKLRYSKVIICADADPAGHFITALLVSMFADLMPDIIKGGKLFVCKTPLYGHGQMKNFVPLWTDSEVEKAKKEKKSFRRIKGLGELCPEELKGFILDPNTRILEQVQWPKKNSIESVFKLLESSEEKRKLVFKR